MTVYRLALGEKKTNFMLCLLYSFLVVEFVWTALFCLGRVSIKIQSRNTQIQMRKAERKNKVHYGEKKPLCVCVCVCVCVHLCLFVLLIQMKQLRANKRHVAYMTKRNVGVEGSPPHLVVYHNNSIGVGGVSCTTRLSIKWLLTSIIVPLVQHIVFHLKCLW